MRKIFRKIINLFVSWILKYKSKCEIANKFYNDLNKKYGSSRISVMDGMIDMNYLNKPIKIKWIIKWIKKKQIRKSESLKSEYVKCSNLNDESLQDMLNECVRKKLLMKLIIVHEKKVDYS